MGFSQMKRSGLAFFYTVLVSIGVGIFYSILLYPTADTP